MVWDFLKIQVLVLWQELPQGDGHLLFQHTKDSDSPIQNRCSCANLGVKPSHQMQFNLDKHLLIFKEQ